MKLTISDKKTGKAYSKDLEKPEFIGKKIGDEISLDNIGLAGYSAKITGGSDKNGFPMKPTVEGSSRRKIRMKGGIGFKPKKKGLYRRKSVRGKIVSDNINQLNLIVTKHGSEKLEKILAKKEEKKEEGEEKKEETEKAEKKPEAATEQKKEKPEKADEKAAEEKEKKENKK